ncbi:MAG: hypothetical protein WD267_11495 [Balneolales bacterium]
MMQTKSKMKNTGKADGSKRYASGKYPEYHAEYQHRIKRSAILSDSAKTLWNPDSNALTGVGNARASLAELVGNDEGVYVRDGHFEKARIPSIKSELEKIHNAFKIWQKRQLESGQSFELPKQWPSDLLTKRLRAEAIIDVYTREKSVLESRIVELQERAKKDHEKGILPFGPIGELGKKGNAIISVDGQRLTFDAKGRPVISETSSPYDGLSLYHYQQMAKAWVDEHHLKKNHHQEVAVILREFEKSKSKKLSGEPKWALEIAKRYLEYSDKGYHELKFTIGKIYKWRQKYDWSTKDQWPEWPKGINKVE